MERWHKGRRKKKKKGLESLGTKLVITPLGVLESSKMNGEESSLEVDFTQDKTQI